MPRAGGARSAPYRPIAGTPRRRHVTSRWLAVADSGVERYLVGGVDSPVRAFKRVGGKPVLALQSHGSTIVDQHGRSLVDLIMGWGALILGHGEAAVREAAEHQVGRGALFGLTSPLEGQLARTIAEAIPSIEQVRFVASGTEADMTAIRLARAATGRSKVLSFEGCYHGHSDGLLVKRGSGLATLGLAASAGVPKPIAKETIVMPYNDTAAFDEAMDRFGRDTACVILEPIAANMGLVSAAPAFLRRVRERTAEQSILLIFDEVVSGFRLSYGGAQQALGVAPDLTVLGKIIGGGFPIGAVGGPSRLMRRLAPEGDVYHAGTFAGHPVAMAAGLAALQELKRRQPYARLDRLGATLARALRAEASNARVAAQVHQLGSLLTVFFTDAAVVDFASAQASNARRFAAFANALRDAGILIPPSPFETWFFSTAHTDDDLRRILAALPDAFAQAAGS